jgi:phenylalanine-4-hydroxylase
VEFGLVREGGQVKAFGAGVLSSYGELQHVAAGRGELLPFDPGQPLPKISYRDGYQARYFVLDSFEDGAARVEAYCRGLRDRLPERVRRGIEGALGAAP